MKPNIALVVMLISVSMTFSTFALPASGQNTQVCEQCGMTVDATSQAHFQVVDANGTLHYAECAMCALKLLAKYDALNITSYCDYSGPSTPITITAKQHGAVVTVNPPSALVIAGGGCMKNRIVSTQAAAIALLANNGTSNYLTSIQKYMNGVSGMLVTVPNNSTIMTIAQAALQFGGSSPSPSPSPSSAPTQSCEQCGMSCPADTQAHFKITDGSGNLHFACCIKCAIKLFAKIDTLNITTNCDWYGPNFPITVSLKDGNLNAVTITPSTAMIIDGSCAKNRVVYDQTAANALLANNGSSRYLVASQNTTVLSNSTVMTLPQAIKTYGVSASPPPSPTASPTSQPTATPVPTPTQPPAPTATPANTQTPVPTVTPTAAPTEQPTQSATATPTVTPQPTTSTPAQAPIQTATPAPTQTPVLTTQTCEVCGMEVTPTDQLRYVVKDSSGNVHYVECFSCALHTVTSYESVHIATCCDWYGTNYPIVIDSSNYGKAVTVSPPTAMFLQGGSCVTNRAAYNQTAADALMANGYSQNTLPEQQYQLPPGTTVSTVKDYIATFAQTSITDGGNYGNNQTVIFVAVAVAGVAVIASALAAYKKFSKKA